MHALALQHTTQRNVHHSSTRYRSRIYARKDPRMGWFMLCTHELVRILQRNKSFGKSRPSRNKTSLHRPVAHSNSVAQHYPARHCSHQCAHTHTDSCYASTSSTPRYANTDPRPLQPIVANSTQNASAPTFHYTVTDMRARVESCVVGLVVVVVVVVVGIVDMRSLVRNAMRQHVGATATVSRSTRAPCSLCFIRAIQ